MNGWMVVWWVYVVQTAEMVVVVGEPEIDRLSQVHKAECEH